MKTLQLGRSLFAYLLILCYFFFYHLFYQDLIRAFSSEIILVIIKDFAIGIILVLAGVLLSLDRFVLKGNLKIKIEIFNLLVFALPAIYLYAVKFNLALIMPLKFLTQYLSELTTLSLFLIGIAIGKSIIFEPEKRS